MDNSIVKKIKKLIALSESPNQNEAENAMMKVSELLEKYNLSMNKVNLMNSEDEEITNYNFINNNCGRFMKWKLQLLNTISYYNFCQMVYMSNRYGTTINIFGKQNNIIVVEEMYKYMYNVIENMTEKIKGASAKNAYRLGIILSIATKFQKKRDMQKNSEAGKELLVLHNKENEKLNKYVNSYYKHGIKSETIKSKIKDSKSYYQGYADGKNISINQQIN